MYPRKAKLVAGIFLAVFFLLMAALVALAPWTLTWILWLFAFPGACKFARVTYIWLLDKGPAPEPEEAPAPEKAGQTNE